MKLGPVTKPNKKKKIKNPQKLDDEDMSTNCDVIVIFWFMANLGQSTNRITDFCKTYIFINSNVFFYKNWKRN